MDMAIRRQDEFRGETTQKSDRPQPGLRVKHPQT